MTEKEKEKDLGGEPEAVDAPSTDEAPVAEEQPVAPAEAETSTDAPPVAETSTDAPPAAEAPAGEEKPQAEAKAPAEPKVEEVPTVAEEDLPDEVRRQQLYEVMFVVHQGRASENFEAVRQELEQILTGPGGTIRNLAKWDDRRLAYRIGRRHRAFYLLGHFHAPPGTIPQIERTCRLSDLVLRVMITRDEDGVQVARPTSR